MISLPVAVTSLPVYPWSLTVVLTSLPVFASKHFFADSAL